MEPAQAANNILIQLLNFVRIHMKGLSRLNESFFRKNGPSLQTASDFTLEFGVSLQAPWYQGFQNLS